MGSVPATRSERWALYGAATLLVAQQVACKATRDALFLVSFDPRRLPLVMGAGAVVSLLTVLVMGRALTRFGPRRVVAAGLALHGALFACEWLASSLQPGVVAVAVYLHIAALGAVLVSGFWSLVSERSDPHRARKVVARVGAAAALGGVLGGLGVRALAGALDPQATLLGLAALNGAAALAVVMLPGRANVAPPADETETTSRTAPLGVLVRSPYLRALAVVSVLAATWQALLDFALQSGAAHAFHGNGESLISFFALFYTATSLATFMLQSLLGPIVLSRGGLATTVATLPMVALVGVGALLGAPFAVVVALRGTESVVANSFFRSAYEVLFAPVPAATKRPTKTIIDVAASRVGDGLGALLVLGLLLVWPHPAAAAPLVIAAAVAAISLVAVRRVARGYVETLENVLQTRTPQLTGELSPDATTRRAEPETTTTLDANRLYRDSDPGAPPGALEYAELAARFDALRSKDPERVRAVLAEPLEPELVRVALPLIAHAELGREVVDALRAVADGNIGTLTDALADITLPLDVRVRIPRLLRSSTDPRAMHSLVSGLRDEQLDVRYYCARCVAHIVSLDASQAPRVELVLDAVQRALDDYVLEWSSTTLLAEIADHDEPLPLDELVRRRASRGLDHVFTLLSIVVDGEPLRLALRGLSSDLDDVRGTALELLENILPYAIRRPVVTVLGRRPDELARPPRQRESLIADLRRSAELRHQTH